LTRAVQNQGSGALRFRPVRSDPQAHVLDVVGSLEVVTGAKYFLKCPARSGSRRRRLSLGRAHVQGDHAPAAAGLNRFMGPRDLCQWKAPLDHRGQLARLGQLREARKLLD